MSMTWTRAASKRDRPERSFSVQGAELSAAAPMRAAPLVSPAGTPLTSPEKPEKSVQATWPTTPPRAGAGARETPADATARWAGTPPRAMLQVGSGEAAGELIARWIVWRRAFGRLARYSRERVRFRRALAAHIRRYVALRSRSTASEEKRPLFWPIEQ